MEGKFLRGVISGLIAGILKDIPDSIFHYVLKITDISFWDYAGFVALKRHPRTLLEFVLSFWYEVIFSTFIALIFIYLIPYLTTRHYLLRGAIYGALVWFAVHVGVLAFHIDGIIVRSDAITGIVNSMNSVLYGVILAYVIHRLEKRERDSKTG